METTTYVELSPTMFVSWQKRLLNLVVDIAALFVIMMIYGVIAAVLAILGNDGMLVWFAELDGVTDRVFTTVTMILYLILMEVFTQRTLGKYVTGTMVVMEDGSKPTARAIVIRGLCRIIPFESFSFLGAYPRGWHDTASGTYVVDAKKYKEALNVQNSFEHIGLEEI